MDIRRQSRKEVSNLVVEISNGNELFSGVARNISHSGLVVDDVPTGIKHHTEKLKINLFSNDHRYRLSLFPGGNAKII